MSVTISAPDADRARSSRWLSRCLMVGIAAAALMPLALVVPPKLGLFSVEMAQAATRPTLRLGSRGGTVEELQALLTLLGYYRGNIDGNFQASTETAVKDFQQDTGLAQDGIVGPATWDKLLPTPSTDLNPPEVPADSGQTASDSGQGNAPPQEAELPTLRIGMRGSAVARVQEALDSLGFYNGAIDGIFGPGTEAAVKAFQRSENLAADGVVGPATWRALLR